MMGSALVSTSTSSLSILGWQGKACTLWQSCLPPPAAEVTSGHHGSQLLLSFKCVHLGEMNTSLENVVKF